MIFFSFLNQLFFFHSFFYWPLDWTAACRLVHMPDLGKVCISKTNAYRMTLDNYYRVAPRKVNSQETNKNYIYLNIYIYISISFFFSYTPGHDYYYLVHNCYHPFHCEGLVYVGFFFFFLFIQSLIVVVRSVQLLRYWDLCVWYIHCACTLYARTTRSVCGNNYYYYYNNGCSHVCVYVYICMPYIHLEHQPAMKDPLDTGLCVTLMVSPK